MAKKAVIPGSYIELTTQVLGIDHKIYVYYEWHKKTYGAREGGVPIEPDEPAGAEITMILLECGNDLVEVDATENEIEWMQDEVAAYIGDRNE